MTPEQRLRELPKAIIKWYEIEKESRIACLVHEEGNSVRIAEALEEMGLRTERLAFNWPETEVVKEGKEQDNTARVEKSREDAWSRYEKERFDIIVAVDILEYAGTPGTLLERIRSLLKPDGRLLLAADNRLGIRYFCGDQDSFTGKNFDSIENYRHLLYWERNEAKGRACAKAEIIHFLETAGFTDHRFFSVFPRLSNPQVLIAEDYEPNEALDIRIFPEYNSPDTIFLMEEELYPSLMENHLLHGMANGFFVECPLNGVFSPVNQVTLSGERGPENAMATILRSDGIVIKRALYQEGKEKIQRLYDNNQYLQKQGVQMIAARIEGRDFVMPYVSGVPANDYFRMLFVRNKESFLESLDTFWEIILHSSEHARFEEINWEQFEPGWEKRKKDDPNKDKWKMIASGTEKERADLGVILKRGYPDLVSLNCFYQENRFIFYDQELYLKNMPAKAILLRTIEFIYKFNDQLDEIIPRKELFERYGLETYRDLFSKFIGRFLNILRGDDGLSDYFKEGRRDYGTVEENRKRLNYSGEEYAMIFKDIFHHTRGRKLYLFGSGNYAKRFREKYGEIYPVAGYLDNDESRQGTEVEGLPVLSPLALNEMNPAEYKVLICIRNYMPLVRQLRRAGIPNFSVYNPYLVYREEHEPEAEEQPKKYNVGYVAGVFDLFHIGHLNLLRRAKEQCNYLIVGVVTDEGVIRHKKSNPKIPYEERIAIVRACRYVDEAVEIPLNKGDTDEAWRKYRFDAQFSGSDYADDPKWLAKKDFLQRHGSDLVFFPYTEGISTTQLKDVVKGNGEKK